VALANESPSRCSGRVRPQLYTKESVFEVPLSVEIVTGTDVDPLAGGGTITEQEVLDEQVVGAVTLPNRAKT